MKTVHTYIARGRGLDDLEPLTIVCDQRVPDCESFEDSREAYQEAARRLLDALGETIPGGLMDALLAELCHRKAVLLTVPLTTREG